MTNAISRNPSDYIYLPDIAMSFAKSEALRGSTNDLATRVLTEVSYLKMPTISQFMAYFMNIINAQKGKSALRDCNDRVLPSEEINEIYERIVLGKNGGVRTHLNARFSKGRGFNGLNIETNLLIHEDRDTKIERVSFVRCPLEQCIFLENRYACIEINSQGLPIKKANTQIYQPGKNMLFSHPREGATAWFSAIKGEAGLYCDRDPQLSDPLIGVLACSSGVVRGFVA